MFYCLREKNNLLSSVNQYMSSPRSHVSTHSSSSSQPNPHPNNDYNIYTYRLKRRTETFAEAEQRLKSRQCELGIIGAGEIAGMCEIMFGMNTYMQSTLCLENCAVFYIMRNSFERLILKRNPRCAQRIRELLLLKFETRNERLGGKQPAIELFRSLQYRLDLLTAKTRQKRRQQAEQQQSKRQTRQRPKSADQSQTRFILCHLIFDTHDFTNMEGNY